MMKRIKELTFLTLAMFFVAAFFGEYAVTASAPSAREEVAMAPAEPAQKSARGSFLEQVINSTPLRFKPSPAVTTDVNAIVEKAKLDVPEVEPAADKPEPA